RRLLGTSPLRLVGSQPRRDEDQRLQCVGRRLGPHLHLHSAARWEDRPGRRGRARRQEPQGMVRRAPARLRRQEYPGKAIREHREGHRSTQRAEHSKLAAARPASYDKGQDAGAMTAPLYTSARTFAPRLAESFAQLSGTRPVVSPAGPGSLDAVAIERMIDAAFWASLQRDEGHGPEISIAFLPPAHAFRPLLF